MLFPTSTLPLPLLLLLLLLLLALPTTPQPPALPPPSPQYTDPPLFISTILTTTNAYRAEHNATPLTYNTTLATYATTHIQPCLFAHTHGSYGENLASGYPNVTAAVSAWGNERDRYDFAHPGFSEATGHFTQLVWKATVWVGCAAKACGASGWLVFCEYFPAGNVEGEFGGEVQGRVGGGGTTAAVTATATGATDDSAVGRYVQYLHAKFSAASGREGVWWAGLLVGVSLCLWV